MARQLSGRLEQDIKTQTKTEKRLEVLPSVVSDWYYSLIAANKSAGTAYTYVGYIAEFYNFVTKGKVDEDFYQKVTARDVDRYMANIMFKTVKGRRVRTSDSIRGVKHSAINNFFEFCKKRGYTETNVVSMTDRPKTRFVPEVDYLTQSEIRGMAASIKARAPIESRNRDLALFQLGVSTGLRISAMLNLNIEDIDFDKKSLTVSEKGQKTFTVLMGDSTAAQLKTWMADREEFYHPTTNAMFVTRRGRMSDDMFNILLKDYAQGVTDKHVTAHVLRHSCATALYEATEDIYVVSKQLHHSNVNVTTRYATISKKKQREAANILDELL